MARWATIAMMLAGMLTSACSPSSQSDDDPQGDESAADGDPAGSADSDEGPADTSGDAMTSEDADTSGDPAIGDGDGDEAMTDGDPDQPSACAVDTRPDCAVPGSGNVTLCGRLFDLESDAPLGDTSEAACTASPTSDGPCSVELKFYDALDYAQNPSGATPLVPAQLVVDECGRFRASDLARPALGSVAIVVDDAASTTDRHVPGIVVVSTVAGELHDALHGYAARRATDAAWSSTAGITGQTFAERGVLVILFRHQGSGVAGVQVRRNGNLATSDDFYFADADQLRSTVDGSSSSTGANGAALVINSTLTTHDGIGGEPTACRWPAALGGSTPGAVSVMRADAVTVSDGSPCP